MRRVQRRRTWIGTGLCKQLWFALHIGYRLTVARSCRERESLNFSTVWESCRRRTKLVRSVLLCMKCECADTAWVGGFCLSSAPWGLGCWAGTSSQVSLKCPLTVLSVFLSLRLDCIDTKLRLVFIASSWCVMLMPHESQAQPLTPTPD